MSLLLLFVQTAPGPAPTQRNLGGSRRRKPHPPINDDEELLQIVRAIAIELFDMPRGK